MFVSDENIVQVMVSYDNKNYLLCSLKKNTTWQVPLDLNFQEGTKIGFTSNGHGNVHLTGYLIPDDDLDLDELEEEEEDDYAPQLVNKQSKRKAIENLKSENKAKHPKQEIEAEFSEDEEIELDAKNEESDSEDSEAEDESLLNEKDDEEDSEDEEDDDDEEEEEEVEEKKTVKPQQKDKKGKQQQQQQQKKKEDKKKMANGKEVKQEAQNKQQKQNKGEKQQTNQNVQNEQKKRVVEGGVQIEELKVGNGAPAKAGRFVTVYYVGRLMNGKKFDSTTQGSGFSFRLGKGEVIKGWDVGIQGMKVGGKRRITIPPAMAYVSLFNRLLISFLYVQGMIFSHK